MKLGRAAVEHCCFLISQKLLDVDDVSSIQHPCTDFCLPLILQTSLTAAHCAKTLVASASTGNPTLRQCVRLLIPALVEFIAKMAPLVHEGSITEPQAAAIGEIWKAFSIFFSTVSEDLRECFLSLFLFSQAHTLQRRCTCPRCLITHHYPPPRQQCCGHTSTERVDIHTGYSPAAYVRYSLTCGVQGGCWEAGSCDEGVVGDVDSESGRRCAGDAGSAGCEAADIASLVLVLRFDTFDILCSSWVR